MRTPFNQLELWAVDYSYKTARGNSKKSLKYVFNQKLNSLYNTKLLSSTEKGSLDGQELLENYYKSNNFKNRYSDKKLNSIISNVEILDMALTDSFKIC